MNINRSFRNGFTLTELLLTLSLLGVFALIATRLFGASLTTMGRSAQGIEVSTRFDAAIDVLRSDMTSSIAADIHDSHSLLLHDANGSTIRWQTDGKQEISRLGAAARRTWEVGQSIELRKDGGILMIHPSNSSDGTADLAIALGQIPTQEK